MYWSSLRGCTGIPRSSWDQSRVAISIAWTIIVRSAFYSSRVTPTCPTSQTLEAMRKDSGERWTRELKDGVGCGLVEQLFGLQFAARSGQTMALVAAHISNVRDKGVLANFPSRNMCKKVGRLGSQIPKPKNPLLRLSLQIENDFPRDS